MSACRPHGGHPRRTGADVARWLGRAQGGVRRRSGRLSAAALARELEVSTRTVLRDIEALSAAGFPVYAERGRHGGFALLPGLRTELTGLNHDEALALLIAGSRRGAQAFGLGSALASAMLGSGSV